MHSIICPQMSALRILAGLLLLTGSLFCQMTYEAKPRLERDNPWLIPVGKALDCDREGRAQEERREYVQAEHSYACAAEYARKTDKLSEAVVYTAELGRARALRKLGQGTEATAICKHWKRRVGHLSRRIVTRPLEDYHWEGKELTESTWEFSCGDQQKAFTLIEAAAKSHQHGYLSTVPYQRLELYYRLLGDAEKAQAAHMQAEVRNHRYRIETGFGGPEDYEALHNSEIKPQHPPN
jgi:hypothetical protein